MMFLYLLVMAVTTYLLRMLPMTLFRGKIKSRFVQSFLAYVPAASLAAMTVPAIFFATDSILAGAVAFLVAVVLALLRRSLITVAACSCAAVFAVQLILSMI